MTRQAPLLGTIAVYPAVGGEAISTTFTMTQLGWTAFDDDYPLSYLYSVAFNSTPYDYSRYLYTSVQASVVNTTLAGWIAASTAQFQIPLPNIGIPPSSCYRGVLNGFYNAILYGSVKNAYGSVNAASTNVRDNRCTLYLFY